MNGLLYTWNLFGPSDGGHQFPVVEFTERTEDAERRIDVGQRVAFGPHDVGRRQHFWLALSQRAQNFVV